MSLIETYKKILFLSTPMEGMMITLKSVLYLSSYALLLTIEFQSLQL